MEALIRSAHTKAFVDTLVQWIHLPTFAARHRAAELGRVGDVRNDNPRLPWPPF
jgi:hypothetical protein